MRSRRSKGLHDRQGGAGLTRHGGQGFLTVEEPHGGLDDPCRRTPRRDVLNALLGRPLISYPSTRTLHQLAHTNRSCAVRRTRPCVLRCVSTVAPTPALRFAGCCRELAAGTSRGACPVRPSPVLTGAELHFSPLRCSSPRQNLLESLDSAAHLHGFVAGDHSEHVGPSRLRAASLMAAASMPSRA